MMFASADALTLLADADPFDIVIACSILIVLVSAGAWAALALRKHFSNPFEDEPPDMGFTLGDLRQLHKGGKISDEEFQRAKEKVIVAAKRAAERAAPKSPKPGPPGPSNQISKPS